MKKIDTKMLKIQCTDGMKKAETVVGGAVEVCKDIVICPKFNSDFRIKSKSREKDLFRINMSMNKEITLFKLILGVIAIFAAIALICMAFDSVFGCSCKKDKAE